MKNRMTGGICHSDLTTDPEKCRVQFHSTSSYMVAIQGLYHIQIHTYAYISMSI